mgnify:CR=1 FL=1
MPAHDLPRLAGIDEADIACFRRDGFLVVERILAPDRIEALRARFPLLFAGKFDTGIYPDEWYWREGMSLPDVTRHMANAWKADLTVARLALSADIGRAAALLAGWSGTRLGQDTIWWKAPLTRPIAHHQDTSFLDVLDPQATPTATPARWNMRPARTTGRSRRFRRSSTASTTIAPICAPPPRPLASRRRSR